MNLPRHPSSLIPRTWAWPLVLYLGIAPFFFFGRSHPLLADSSLQFDVRLSEKGSLSLAEVTEDGRVILALTANAPQDANEKACAIADKLRSLAEAGKTSDSFALLSRAGGPAIVCGPEVVVAVERTPNYSHSPEPVMARWLENIKRAFARPYLSVSSTLLAVRLGREVTLPVRGPGLPSLQVEVTPSYIAQARVDMEMGHVVILGKSVGQARLLLKVKGEALSAAISVLAPLATIALPQEYASDRFPPLAKQPPLVAWFSNHPENVAAPTPLFHAQFPGNSSGRLFYHHKSIARGPLQFAVWLANRDPELTQRLFLIQGTGGPHSEAPISGRNAIASFYSNWEDEKGEFFTLRPGEFRCLKFVAWPPYTTVGGLLQFTCLGDAALDVYVEALDSPYPPYAPSPASLVSPPSKEWLFPGDKQVPFYYVAGDDPTHFLLGLPGERALASQRLLPGSYGVQQRLNILISNPFPTSQRVELRCLAAGGGIAHFVALLNDRILSVELSRTGESASLATFTLPPNGSASASLVTTGVGGCWYPVVLTLQTKS